MKSVSSNFLFMNNARMLPKCWHDGVLKFKIPYAARLFAVFGVFDKPFYRQWGKVFYPHQMKIKSSFYSHFCPKIKVLRHFLSKKRPQRKTPSRSDLIIQFCLLWLMGYAQKHLALFPLDRSNRLWC